MIGRLRSRSCLIGVAISLLLMVSACQPAAPQLVRDGIDMFSDEARAAAEARLQQLAADRGIWVFVITDLEGDPPRMLDEPMGEADAQDARAVAILFGRNGIVGSGYSERATQEGDQTALIPPDVNGLVAQGETDAALTAVVEYLERWAVAPPPEEPPPVPPEQPSAGL